MILNNEMDNQQLNMLEIWKPVKNFKVPGTQISKIRHGLQRIIV